MGKNRKKRTHRITTLAAISIKQMLAIDSWKSRTPATPRDTQGEKRVAGKIAGEPVGWIAAEEGKAEWENVLKVWVRGSRTASAQSG